MLDAYIYDGLRTPIGRHAGSLSSIRPDNLLALCIQGLMERTAFPADHLEDVVIGCTNQAGEDARNVARHAGLLAGLPVTVAAQTQNRLCGSGLSAVIEASRALTCKEGELFLAGGVESMSRAPYVLSKSATPFGRNAQLFDSTIGARFPNPEVEAAYGADSMPQTADNIAKELKITREASDQFALASQHKYQQAKAEGFFSDEILPISVKGKKPADQKLVTEDEHPRPETTLEKLASLKPLFDGGVVTAGNASGVNDAASLLLIGSQALGQRYAIQPRGRILAAAVAGVEPRLMGLGPVPAIQKVLKRAGLKLDAMAVIEINEAFATQVLGCLQSLGVDFNDPRVNPAGGAIALGHPLGASGSRLALTALRQLEKTGDRYAVISLCIGLGQGVAAVIERL